MPTFKRYSNFEHLIKRDDDFRQKKESERIAMKGSSYYAGIGSRQTPEEILNLMEQLANRLREDGMILRTGHAPGADQAFERGAGAQAQIFLPWTTFEQDTAFSASRSPDGIVTHPMVFNEPSHDAWGIAATIHPVWGNLSVGARKLHARNAHQILGPKCIAEEKVGFVICWTPGAKTTGGTGTAITLAEQHNIPIWNLADEDDYDVAFDWAWDHRA